MITLCCECNLIIPRSYASDVAMKQTYFIILYRCNVFGQRIHNKPNLCLWNHLFIDEHSTSLLDQKSVHGIKCATGRLENRSSHLLYN